MDVDLIFKIAGIGMVTAVLHTVLAKSGKEEYAYLTTLVGVVIVLGVVINLVSKLFDNVKYYLNCTEVNINGNIQNCKFRYCGYNFNNYIK